ncbi:hypothetical protein [Saccharopolyspora taberi]|uniref:Uncharacterized protein n=1 Tax=Saccharopolyspora taberi TaxID=60895 RepID=A0ABN3V0F1_9PSEU
MSTCEACREPIIVALLAGKATPFDPTDEPTGDHTITRHPTKGHAIAVKLRPNQKPGARRAGQRLYQLHRRSCTKALSNRRR